ncbi:MAG: hypothetical protein PHQ04_07035 [Opitutaceae bacterium]|nr:hypothetical protein [Opitutaceae bacterium]
MSGCKSPVPLHPPLYARFYLEASPGEPGVPVRGGSITVGARPVLTEYDIANAGVGQTELGQCLQFYLTSVAARDLHRLSQKMRGRRLVLALNDALIGAQYLDRDLPDGTIMMFVEIPDAQLPSLVARIRQTSANLAVGRPK